MPKKDVPKSVRCSFCGKSQENVKKIVAQLNEYLKEWVLRHQCVCAPFGQVAFPLPHPLAH